MRTVRRISLALLTALALTTPAWAQAVDDRISFSASAGPSFANVGTTVSTMAGLDVKVTDRVSVVGELGMLPHAAFNDAAEIAPSAPVAGAEAPTVNAYHWNGNLQVRPFEVGKLRPRLTAGLGTFSADTIVNQRRIGSTTFDDRRRATNMATNLGAGVTYWLNDWAGIGADYRTFFVHRDGADPRVNRFTTGLTLSVK